MDKLLRRFRRMTCFRRKIMTPLVEMTDDSWRVTTTMAPFPTRDRRVRRTPHLPLGLVKVAVLLSISTGVPPRTVWVMYICRVLLFDRHMFLLFTSALQFRGSCLTNLRYRVVPVVVMIALPAVVGELMVTPLHSALQNRNALRKMNEMALTNRAAVTPPTPMLLTRTLFRLML